MCYNINKRKLKNISTVRGGSKMNKKHIDVRYKIIDTMGNYNMFETIEVHHEITDIEIESMLKEVHNKEINLLSYSENIF